MPRAGLLRGIDPLLAFRYLLMQTLWPRLVLTNLEMVHLMVIWVSLITAMVRLSLRIIHFEMVVRVVLVVMPVATVPVATVTIAISPAIWHVTAPVPVLGLALATATTAISPVI